MNVRITEIGMNMVQEQITVSIKTQVVVKTESMTSQHILMLGLIDFLKIAYLYIAPQERRNRMTNKEIITILEMSNPLRNVPEDMRELRPYSELKEAYNRAIEALENQKTGHWIVYAELTGEWEGTKKYACDKCGEKVGVFKSNFCPNCGAKMTETQESEDKE